MGKMETQQPQSEKHLCEIPCDSLPLTGDADFGLALKPIVHIDRTAEFHVLIYVLKGGMEVIEDSAAYELGPGSLFLLKSGVHHWGVREFEKGTAWYYIHFYTPTAREGLPRLEQMPRREGEKGLAPADYRCCLVLPKHLRLPLGNELERRLERFISLYQSLSRDRLVPLNLALWEILLRCWELGRGKAAEMPQKERIEEILSFIEKNYSRNFSAKEIEAEIGLSYKYLCSQFKAETGMTVKRCQLTLRLREAVRLLCETDLPVAEIAARTGFYDEFYFSRVFKREKGIPPSRFRDTYVPSM